MSVLSPMISKCIEDKEKLLIKQQIDSWVLGFASGDLRVKRLDGSIISYGGVEFSGTPQAVFWSDDYIKPFLDDITLKAIQKVKQECSANNLKLEPELRTLSNRLKEAYSKIYNKMARADQQIRGKGFSQDIPLHDVSHRIISVNDFLDQQIEMELKKNSSPMNVIGFILIIWKDPVWSKVIATGIVFCISVIYLYWHAIYRHF